MSQTVSKPSCSSTLSVKWFALPLGTSRRSHDGNRARCDERETTGNSANVEEMVTLARLRAQIGMSGVKMAMLTFKRVAQAIYQC